MRKKSFPLSKTIRIHHALLVASSCLFSPFALSEEITPHEIELSDNLILAEAENNLEASQKNHPKTVATSTSSIAAFDPFTGKVTGNRVRLRLHPSLDSPIIRELSAGELWVITGEVEDFYAVMPEPGTKGYIFRTYVLDGTVEGNNVNLRLKADTQSPVITQLGQGDKVTGEVAKDNPKWLEIDLPSNIRFYIAKEYVQRVGNKSFFNQMIKEKEAILKKLEELKTRVKQELEKSFHDIQLAPLANELKTLASSAANNFPDISQRINDIVASLQEEYLKLSMLHQTKPADFHISKPKEEPRKDEATEEHEGPLSAEKNAKTRGFSYSGSKWSTFSLAQQEESLIQDAIDTQAVKDEKEFYEKEAAKSSILRGIIVPYERMVKNRPGDFILLDATTKVPLAYLYSTKANLTEFVGQPSTEITVVERPNHYFALPAYFVLEIKKSNSTDEVVK